MRSATKPSCANSSLRPLPIATSLRWNGGSRPTTSSTTLLFLPSERVCAPWWKSIPRAGTTSPVGSSQKAISLWHMVAIQAAGARRLLPQTFFDSRAILSLNIGTSCRKKCPRKKQRPATPCLRGRDVSSERAAGDHPPTAPLTIVPPLPLGEGDRG